MAKKEKRSLPLVTIINEAQDSTFICIPKTFVWTTLQSLQLMILRDTPKKDVVAAIEGLIEEIREAATN